jgi:sporulation protein YlmC with PRC-barrel domain
MAETTPFTIGAKASCSDGSCGAVSRVVVNPVTREVTHLVIESDGPGTGRLVPLSLIGSSGDQVTMTCTRAEFDHLGMAEETEFLPGVADPYEAGEVLAWPYYGLGPTGMAGVIDPGAAALTEPIVYDKLPAGEVGVRRGERVHATDGAIGLVQGLVIDPADHHVTHVLLQEGHLWGRKEVAIPITAVTGVEDGIQLSISKQDVHDLPPVELGKLEA